MAAGFAAAAFAAGAFATAAGAAAPAAPAAGAAEPPSAVAPSPSSFFFFFFLITILRTRTFGRPNGDFSSPHLLASRSLAMRSTRVSTLRLRDAPRLTLRLLSIVISHSDVIRLFIGGQLKTRQYRKKSGRRQPGMCRYA